MKCVAVTPEKTAFDREAKFVVLPLYDGEYGVEAGHSPVVGRIGAGELRLTADDGSVESWYIEGGFVEVANDVVSILTNRAFRSSELDLSAAQTALDAALKRPANTLETTELKRNAIGVARAQIRLAEKVARSRR